MSATFVTQRDVQDINEGMAFMANADRALDLFNAQLWPNSLRPSQPISKIREGQKQAELWRHRVNAPRYRQMATHVYALLEFTNYLLPRIAALPRADRTSPISSLGKGKGPLSKYIDWLALYKLQLAEWGRIAKLIATEIHDSYDGMHEGMHNVMPRLLDYMSLAVQLASRYDPSVIPRKMLDDHRLKYNFSTSGMANLLAQQHRITMLLSAAHQRFKLLEKSSNVGRFGVDLEVVAVELRQAQRYCNQLVALRGV